MTFSKRTGLALALSVFALAGCGVGGPKFVPVSGVVTIDGKPYGKAVVNFQPIGTDSNPNPGRGSGAHTDESGRFTLVTDDGDKGAVVGKHRIRIMTRGNNTVVVDPEVGSPDNVPVDTVIDPIPASWNVDSNVEFEVPAGGTDKANFDIVTKP